MKVYVDEFDVHMEFGNNGITVQVYDTDDTHLGKLRIGKATLEWCQGRTRIGNGKKKSWGEVISWFGRQSGARR
jgi:hypothetical protein